jgi:phage tail P2-like protein
MALPSEVLAASLLPPNATEAERAIEDAMRIGADIGMVGSLWNPLTCPADVLPFLAWGLSISRWDENWTVAQKRTETANAFDFHRRKGTRGIVEEVLERFHPLLEIVEWWETNPRGIPGTFEVRAPANAIPASFLTAETTAAIIRDIASVKPVSRHFDFVQTLEVQANIWIDGGANTATFGRYDVLAEHDADPAWSTYLLTEDGEPFETEDGQFLEV